MVIATVLTALFTALMIFGVRAVARYMLVTFVIVWVVPGRGARLPAPLRLTPQKKDHHDER